MAFVLTYNSLTQSVKDYLERNDAKLVSEIPLFIMLGERRVARDLKILGLKVAITGNLIAGDSVFAKPTRWLNDSSFNIGTNQGSEVGFNTRLLLEQRAYEWCRMYWPNPTQTGTPKYYASDYNYNFWIVMPTPDVPYPYEIIYYETPEFIDDSTSSNFLTGSAPEVLLYATLLETASYLKDDERIGVWSDYYEKAKKALGEEDVRRIYDAYSKRGG
jgi:hypothetical protein